MTTLNELLSGHYQAAELPVPVPVPPPPAPGTLTKQQQGWLALAKVKAETFSQLEKEELEIQAILNEEWHEDFSVLADHIKEAKRLAAESKKRRLAFTNVLDEKIISPAMEFEKRTEARIREAMDKELNERKKAALAAEVERNHVREIESLKAHITNEYFRVAAQYRALMRQVVTEGYKACLEARVSPAVLIGYKVAIEKDVRRIKIPPFVKFNRVVVTEEEAKEVLKSINPYLPEQDLTEAVRSIDEVFKMYEQDLLNAEEAIKAKDIEEANRAKEQQEKLELETATNVLLAQASPAMIDVPKIRKKLEILVVESEGWALSVIAAFIKNKFSAIPKLKVKSWSRLNIGQMAEALAKIAMETGEQFPGLEFKEIEK